MSLLYDAEYVNSVFAGVTADGRRFDLVAGSHSAGFPYAGDKPWDNVLLSVGTERYQQTIRARAQLVRFELDHSLENDSHPGSLAIDGPMTSVETGKTLPVSVRIDMVVSGLKPRQEGKRYNVFDVKSIPGLRWHPFVTESAHAVVRIAGKELAIENVVGTLEHGLQSNLRGRRFAFYYDYMALLKPSTPGYAYVWFQTHAVQNGLFGRTLDRYLVWSASEELTLEGGSAKKGNTHGVHRPRREDGSVVGFENRVDLQYATLHRQLISTYDRDGERVSGMREVFEIKKRKTRP